MPLRRIGAGWKLLGLCACSVALLAVDSAAGVGAAVVGLLTLYALAGLGPRWRWVPVLRAQVRPLRWFVPCLLAVQWWLLGPLDAVVLCTRLVVLVALAGLVTATTATTEILDALHRGLRPLRRWVDADRVSLVLALTLRSVPVLTALAAAAREAQQARGRDHDVRAMTVPLVVGALRRADALGEALQARGMDD